MHAPHRRGYAGLAPLEEGLTNVAFVTASAAVADRPGSLEAYFAEGLSGIPALASRLAGASESAASAASGRWPIARGVIDGFVLVGDAASFLDPFTGEGVYEALRGATLLAPIADAALRAGDLSAQRLAPYAPRVVARFGPNDRFVGWCRDSSPRPR